MTDALPAPLARLTEHSAASHVCEKGSEAGMNNHSAAFILHSRPYKETSALLDLFTPQGRIRAVLRRARSAFGGIAQPFILIDIALCGRGELKTLSRLENLAPPLHLGGERLFSALYLNEIIMRLLPQADAQPLLFEHYRQSLALLAAGAPLEPLLRRFEWQLLSAIGYGFALDLERDGQPLKADQDYHWHPEGGLQRSDTPGEGRFSGQSLLALAAGDWTANDALPTAKRLMRQALAAQLGSRPLSSRQLFIRPTAKVSAHD